MKEQSSHAGKRKRKRKNNMRNIVMLTLLCLALMAGATYAWFTLSNTAKVANLSLSVSDVTGLQIADADDSGNAKAYGAVLSIDTIAGKLLPATMTSDEKLMAPEYADDGSVNNVVAIADGDTLPKNQKLGNYYQKYFYIKQMGTASTDYSIVLKPATGRSSSTTPYCNDISKIAGTYAVSTVKSDAASMAAADVRVALYTVSGSTEKLVSVYEPNSDYTATTSNKALDSRASQAVKASTLTQKMDGTFGSAGSANILSLKGGTEQKMKLVVWLEGTDPQCVNEIAADTFAIQLQFASNEG